MGKSVCALSSIWSQRLFLFSTNSASDSFGSATDHGSKILRFVLPKIRENVNIFCTRKMRCLVWFWPSRLRADCLKDLAGLHEVLDVLPQDCVLRLEPQVLLLDLIHQSEMSIVTLHQSQLTLSTRCVRSSSVFCSSNTWAISRAFSSCSSWKYLNVWKIF